MVTRAVILMLHERPIKKQWKDLCPEHKCSVCFFARLWFMCMHVRAVVDLPDLSPVPCFVFCIGVSPPQETKEIMEKEHEVRKLLFSQHDSPSTSQQMS